MVRPKTRRETDGTARTFVDAAERVRHKEVLVLFERLEERIVWVKE